MSINRKGKEDSSKKGSGKEKKDEEVVNHDIKVTRANDIGKCIMFDMEVNGIKIYGCSYRELERNDGSGSFAKIGFPSRKGSDDKYYAQCWFKISEKDLEAIEKGIEALINQ